MVTKVALPSPFGSWSEFVEAHDGMSFRQIKDGAESKEYFNAIMDGIEHMVEKGYMEERELPVKPNKNGMVVIDIMNPAVTYHSKIKPRAALVSSKPPKPPKPPKPSKPCVTWGTW